MSRTIELVLVLLAVSCCLTSAAVISFPWAVRVGGAGVDNTTALAELTGDRVQWAVSYTQTAESVLKDTLFADSEAGETNAYWVAFAEDGTYSKSFSTGLNGGLGFKCDGSSEWLNFLTPSFNSKVGAVVTASSTVNTGSIYWVPPPPQTFQPTLAITSFDDVSLTAYPNLLPVVSFSDNKKFGAAASFDNGAGIAAVAMCYTLDGTTTRRDVSFAVKYASATINERSVNWGTTGDDTCGGITFSADGTRVYVAGYAAVAGFVSGTTGTASLPGPVYSYESLPANPGLYVYSWLPIGASNLANLAATKRVDTQGLADVTAMTTDGDGHVWMTGWFMADFAFDTFVMRHSRGTQRDIFVAELDSVTLAAYFVGAWGGVADDVPRAIYPDHNNNVLICGDYKSPVLQLGTTPLINSGGSDAFVALVAGGTGKVLKALDTDGTADETCKAVVGSAATYVFLAGDFSGSFKFGNATLGAVGPVLASNGSVDAFLYAVQDFYDPCASSPCQNGGTCTKNGGSYVCTCPGDFTTPHGVDCDTFNDCYYENRCLNGGACVDLDYVDTWYCNCQPGYSGANCKINIDECSSGPCMNGANCIDLVNGFSCDCQNSLSGVLCNQECQFLHYGPGCTDTLQYNVATTTYRYIQPPTGTAVSISQDDVLVGPYTLPFPFEFFGEIKRSFYLSSNGFLTFDLLAATNGLDAMYIPRTLGNRRFRHPKDFVAFFWADLDPTAVTAAGTPRVSVFTHVPATGPRRFVIEFSNVPYHQAVYPTNAASIPTVSLQVHLVEMVDGSSDIQVHVQHADSSIGGVTIGLEDKYGMSSTAGKTFFGQTWASASPFTGTLDYQSVSFSDAVAI